MPDARISSISSAPITATTTAVNVGEVPVSRPRATPVTRDVADAVAHQGEPALDQVGADPGRGEPGDGGGDDGADHERRVAAAPTSAFTFQRHRQHRPARAGRPRWWWLWPLPVDELVRRTVVGHPALAESDDAVDERRERAELVEDDDHAGARGGARRPASRRWPPGWRGRLPRWARRAGAARAPRPACRRPAPAAAGHRQGTAGVAGPVVHPHRGQRRGDRAADRSGASSTKGRRRAIRRLGDDLAGVAGTPEAKSERCGT